MRRVWRLANLRTFSIFAGIVSNVRNDCGMRAERGADARRGRTDLLSYQLGGMLAALAFLAVVHASLWREIGNR